MIEGLKIDVSADELTSHLNERVEYHKAKREFYEKQVQGLRDGGVGQGMQSNDPVSSLQGSAKSHGDREGLFRFLADHVVTDETYRLSEQDLTRLEIIGRYL
jgi:hypothetical protein